MFLRRRVWVRPAVEGVRWDGEGGVVGDVEVGCGSAEGRNLGVGADPVSAGVC